MHYSRRDCRDKLDLADYKNLWIQILIKLWYSKSDRMKKQKQIIKIYTIYDYLITLSIG
jgi:hypothetical protein